VRVLKPELQQKLPRRFASRVVAREERRRFKRLERISDDGARRFLRVASSPMRAPDVKTQLVHSVAVKATEYEYLLGHFLCGGLLEASRHHTKETRTCRIADEPVEMLKERETSSDMQISIPLAAILLRRMQNGGRWGGFRYTVSVLVR
jgi:hypothetical protein